MCFEIKYTFLQYNPKLKIACTWFFLQQIYIPLWTFFLRPLWTRHARAVSVPDCTMIGSGWCRRLYKIDIGRLGPLISVAPATGDSYQQYQPGAEAASTAAAVAAPAPAPLLTAAAEKKQRKKNIYFFFKWQVSRDDVLFKTCETSLWFTRWCFVFFFY